LVEVIGGGGASDVNGARGASVGGAVGRAAGSAFWPSENISASETVFIFVVEVLVFFGTVVRFVGGFSNFLFFNEAGANFFCTVN